MSIDLTNPSLPIEHIVSSEESHVSPEALVISFVMGGLLLGGLLREVKKKTGIPYTPMLFTTGILLGIQSHYYGLFGGTIENISQIDPRQMLLIFLPPLVFSVGYNIDWHKFKKQAVQISILSGPCVLISACLIAVALKLVLNYSNDYYTWASAFMFGSILSCTDTRTVVALLKENGASKKFSSLIEGESLINDGTCMVLLLVSSDVVLGKPYTPFSLAIDFLELTLGGIVLGILVGIICVFWIRKVFNDDVMVVNVTFLACYLVYFFAENNNLGIRISGIVALITLGLFMAAFGKSRINSESTHSVHSIWDFATFCAETIVFLMAGIIIGFRVFLRKYIDASLPVLSGDFFKLLILYTCMMLARYIGILIFMPILRKHGYGLTSDEAFFLTYGGLRGAIGISLAFVIGRDKAFDPTLRHFILFDMAGCALLTVLINGSTLGYLIRKKDFSIDIIKQKVFVSNVELLIKKIKQFKHEITILPELTEVDWSKLDSDIGIPKYERLIKEKKSKIASMEKEQQRDSTLEINPLKIFADSPELEKEKEKELLEKDSHGNFIVKSEDRDNESDGYEDDLEEKLVTECRNRFIKALQGEYYRLFMTNQCSPSAYLILKESVNSDLDNVGDPMSSWDFVSNYFTNPMTIKILFFLKRIPMCGHLARKNLFNHIFFVYDVVLNYLNAHDSCEKIAETFPFSEDIIASVQEESEENKSMAESYLKNYLNISFPEIFKDIQIKKASTSMLNHQKSKILNAFTKGQLEEKEYKQLKDNIDQSLFDLTENYGSWDLPPLKEFLKKITFFSYFTDEEIDDLLSDAIERPFQKDEFIVKEGEKAKYVYILTRGTATESCKSSSIFFKERKDVSSIVSCHQIVSGFRRYETSCIADSLVYAVRIDLNKLKTLIKGHIRMNEYLWKESFFFLTRFYNEELDMLSGADPHIINQIVNLFTLKKYRPNSKIDFSKGGIFLKGQAKEVDILATNVDSNEEIHETHDPTKIYQSLSYIPPSKSKFLITDKYSWVFHFINFERIMDLINRGAADKERSRSRSFLGYQKHEIHPKSNFRKDIKPDGNTGELKGEDHLQPLFLQKGNKCLSDTQKSSVKKDN